jgi:hypothetical protein
MADNIDPRLSQQFASLPPRSLAQQQSYTAAPAQHNGATPYYLPTPTNAHHHPALQAAPPQIDPALEQTSPQGPAGDESHDEDDHDDAELDGYVSPGQQMPRRRTVDDTPSRPGLCAWDPYAQEKNHHG